MKLSQEHAAALLDIARQVIGAGLAGREVQLPAPADADLHQPAGCFVSLHEQGTHRLRGCVGRLDAQAPVYLSVAHAARGALDDPRFTGSPITAAELPRLDLEISVLSPLREAADPLDFDPLNDGIFLSIGQRSGCFLPQVARQTGWSREHLLDRLCSEKLGLSAASWRHSSAKLHKFSVLIIGPVAFVESSSAPSPREGRELA